MDFKKLGVLSMILAAIIALGTYLHQQKLEKRGSEASMQTTISLASSDSLAFAEARQRGQDAYKKISELNRWYIGSGLLAVFGLVILLSAKPASHG